MGLRVRRRNKNQHAAVALGSLKHFKRSPVLDGPFCGALRRKSVELDPSGRRKRCMNPAGFKTDHPGVGRCKFHGGNAPVKHGWYSRITHTRIMNIMDEIALVEMNAMDLIPEANLLRAMIVDFVNRYEEWEEMLTAWYKDPENKARPRRPMDLSDASFLIESVSRVVHRMHQIQSEGSISLDTFRRVTEHMGMIVANHVKDSEVLKKIELEWSTLALDARSSTPGAMTRAAITADPKHEDKE